MTKLELLAALANLPDDTMIYVDPDGKTDLLSFTVHLYNNDDPAFVTLRI